MREGEVKDARVKKKTLSPSVTGIPLRSVLVNMDRINYTSPYSNRRIPEHANFVAMITAQVSSKGFMINHWSICPENQLITGL